MRLAPVLGADALDLLIFRYAEETGDLLSDVKARNVESSVEYRRLRNALTARLLERVADARRHGWAPAVSRYPGAVEMRIFDTSDPDENLRFVDFMDSHGHRAKSEIVDVEIGCEKPDGAPSHPRSAVSWSKS